MILHKTMLNLTPQGNHTAMMRQWESITKTMESKGYTPQEIYHDIGIILIGDWQRAYVRTRLDELFASSKAGGEHTINMGEFINNLQARTSVTKPGGYLPLYYPIYMQDAHLGPIAGKPEPPKLNTFKGGNTPRSPSNGPNQPNQLSQPSQHEGTAEDCPHCHRGKHTEDNCWVLHPEKRPRGPFYRSRKQPSQGTANLLKSARLTDGWVFDTAASWIIYNDQSAFKDYISLNHEATVTLPDGSIHRVEGVGNISLSTSKGEIELKNA